MSFISIPIIIISTYILIEIFKLCTQKKQDTFYKFIPILSSIIGGLISAIIYFTNREILLSANSLYEALTIGFVSGASATGSNQIIKQLFFKKGDEQSGE